LFGREPTPASNGVGRRVLEARRARGLSQRSLAEPGISYAYISRIEGGTRTPSVKALRKLAPKLGVSVEWLETGVEPSRWSGFGDGELATLARALHREHARQLLEEVERERARRARGGA
jgi:transcriptional regulator with XRE-family HTH domain